MYGRKMLLGIVGMQVQGLSYAVGAEGTLGVVGSRCLNLWDHRTEWQISCRCTVEAAYEWPMLRVEGEMMNEMQLGPVNELVSW